MLKISQVPVTFWRSDHRGLNPGFTQDSLDACCQSMFIGVTTPSNEFRLKLKSERMITLRHSSELRPFHRAKPGGSGQSGTRWVSWSDKRVEEPVPLLSCWRIQNALPTHDDRWHPSSSE